MLIEIAGTPFELRCQYAENRAFFEAYRTEKAPLFSIAPAPADRAAAQAGLDRMAEAEGKAAVRCSEAFLENNAIHALLAEKLTAYHVLLMHGSALCMDGEAYLFTARSGTGKSTHARLWREAFGPRVWMINDDKPMLRIGEGGVTVYGTPWDGKHHLSRNASAPLKAVVKLERGAENRIEPMTEKDALLLVHQQAYVSPNPGTMKRIVEMETELLRHAAFYRLQCSMEPEAARVAWRGMNGGARR